MRWAYRMMGNKRDINISKWTWGKYALLPWKKIHDRIFHANVCVYTKTMRNESKRYRLLVVRCIGFGRTGMLTTQTKMRLRCQRQYTLNFLHRLCVTECRMNRTVLATAVVVHSLSQSFSRFFFLLKTRMRHKKVV